MKTEQTIKLERAIWKATQNQGTFGCLEVTIGWFGRERVDYMTYNTKGEFRCYEIKVTKSDFRSRAHNTFVGHFNYYVLTPELYEQVKDEIPRHLGIFVGGNLMRKARRQTPAVDAQTLKDSMIRSLCRDVAKQINSGNPTLIEIYKREVANAKEDARYWKKAYTGAMQEVLLRYGSDWDAAPVAYDQFGEEI